MWEKLKNWWKEELRKMTFEGEDWEYLRYLNKHPERFHLTEGKSKAQLAEELYQWMIRSNEQAITINKLMEEYDSFKIATEKHYLDATTAMFSNYATNRTDRFKMREFHERECTFPPI